MVIVSNPRIHLHDGQLAMLRSKARTTVVTAGQGGGKTTGWYNWVLSNMQAYPGESHLVGFPDYGLLQRVILNQPDPDRPTFPDFLRDMGEKPKLYVQEKRIVCPSGQVFFNSGEDLVGWEGAHVLSGVLDEFDLMSLEAYRRAMERTRMRHGWVLLTGTPRRVAWVKTELEPRWLAGDPGVCHIQFPSTMNPKYSPEAMAEAKRLLPDWEYRRLYLGEMAEMEGGGVFRREWWKYYTEAPVFQQIVQVWDTAFKDKTSADYSVCATWGASDTGFYLLDLWRAKVEFPELQITAQNLYAKWKPGRVLIEDAASGQSLVQALQRQSKVPVVPIKVDRDKYSRASAVTGLVESGRVFIPQSAPWLHDFLEEHASFPNGQQDDIVDTSSLGLGWLSQHSGRRVGMFV